MGHRYASAKTASERPARVSSASVLGEMPARQRDSLTNTTTESYHVLSNRVTPVAGSHDVGDIHATNVEVYLSSISPDWFTRST